MEIRSVEAVPLRRELGELFANAQKWIDSREYCLVRIETDDGTVGWGECWGPVAGNREIVAEYLAPEIEGRDPRNVAAIHDDLRFETTASYHSYVPVSALSGVDIALWDVYGKAVGEPVSRLLGGRRRDAARAYATGHFFRDVDDFSALREAAIEEARGHVAAGFDALKVKLGLDRHFPWGPEEDIAYVAAIREAVGEAVTIAADANHAYDRATARQVGERLADLDVRFFEEPVPPRAIDDYAALNDQLSVPLAGGECWAFEEFDRVLDSGAVGVVQPDVTSAGGITATSRVADRARGANAACYPHVFGSAVALAASLQVLATLPGDPFLEFDRTPNPIREDLAVEPIENEGNSVPIPDRPGIGVEIDEDVLAEFRI